MSRWEPWQPASPGSAVWTCVRAAHRLGEPDEPAQPAGHPRRRQQRIPEALVISVGHPLDRAPVARAAVAPARHVRAERAGEDHVRVDLAQRRPEGCDVAVGRHVQEAEARAPCPLRQRLVRPSLHRGAGAALAHRHLVYQWRDDGLAGGIEELRREVERALARRHALGALLGRRGIQPGERALQRHEQRHDGVLTAAAVSEVQRRALEAKVDRGGVVRDATEPRDRAHVQLACHRVADEERCVPGRLAGCRGGPAGGPEGTVARAGRAAAQLLRLAARQLHARQAARADEGARRRCGHALRGHRRRSEPTRRASARATPTCKTPE